MDDRVLVEKVRICVAQALGLDLEDAVPDAVLFDDLGAESLDLLDIVFRLEKTLGFKYLEEESRITSFPTRASKRKTWSGTAY